MQPFVYPGCIDGEAMIEMNNLSVGYFPTRNVGFGVYPVQPPEPLRPLTGLTDRLLPTQPLPSQG